MSIRYFQRFLAYIVLSLLSVINILPILWMALNSFKSGVEYSQDQFSIPHLWAWSNYTKAWETANLGVFFGNSIYITFISIILTVFLSSLASFFLARFEFKGRNLLYSFFLIGMLVPIHATLVPLFLLMQKLNLLDTRAALIITYTSFHLPITIFILVGFMRTFSREIEEAAVMDGCSLYGTFFRIILPMTRPAIATVIILNFVYNWNEYLLALVLIGKTSLKTIPLGIASFSDMEVSNPTLQMAALTMVLIPTVIFYLLMEKQLVKGMTSGAVKG
jgi:raffinose/stachyose/melibiose transport system permease protein